jgi:hypothetical protein
LARVAIVAPEGSSWPNRRFDARWRRRRDHDAGTFDKIDGDVPDAFSSCRSRKRCKSRIHLCRGRRSTADEYHSFPHGSGIVVSPWEDCRCPEVGWRNRIVRPASLGPSDAAVEFISTQSPDVAVAMPPRVFRAEKNLVRAGRAEFTLSRSPSNEPGRAWVFSRAEAELLGPNKRTSRSPTRRGALA